MDHTADKVDKVELKVEELEKRLAKMEQGGSTTAGSEAARPGRQTLVFGGWQTQTRRQVILRDLDRALGQANVKSQLDDDPFTTGARRTVSCCNFYMRSGENEALLKRRMFSVIQAFNANTYHTERGKRIWVSFSKTKEERLRGAHAAWTKRILQELRIDLQHASLDLEYGTASAWLEDSKIAGLQALESQDKVYVDDGNPEKPYLHLSAIARELGISVSELQQAVEKTKR